VLAPCWKANLKPVLGLGWASPVHTETGSPAHVLVFDKERA